MSSCKYEHYHRDPCTQIHFETLVSCQFINCYLFLLSCQVVEWVMNNMGQCEKKTQLASLLDGGNFKLKHLSYDWSLNSSQSKGLQYYFTLNSYYISKKIYSKRPEISRTLRNEHMDYLSFSSDTQQSNTSETEQNRNLTDYASIRKAYATRSNHLAPFKPKDLLNLTLLQVNICSITQNVLKPTVRMVFE